MLEKISGANVSGIVTTLMWKSLWWSHWKLLWPRPLHQGGAVELLTHIFLPLELWGSSGLSSQGLIVCDRGELVAKPSGRAAVNRAPCCRGLFLRLGEWKMGAEKRPEGRRPRRGP